MSSDDICGVLMIGLMVAGGFGVKGCMVEQSKSRAEFYNKTYGINVTERDVFWNDTQVKEYLEMKNPKRPETNNINATLKLDK